MIHFIKSIVLLFLFSAAIPAQSASDVENFFAQLKTHYQTTQSIQKFSMTHNYLYLGSNASYSAWDYQAPNRYTAFKVTEFDLEKDYYYENVIHHYAGGRKHNEVHFQNDTSSLRYAKNGAPYGKQIIKQDMSEFEGFKNLIVVNVDFFAVRPLLAEKNVAATIKLYHDKNFGRTTLIHKASDDKVVEYTFSTSPLRLLSLNNKSLRRIYFYDDYQTTNNLTFARSIVQYANGDMTPTFIKHIASLNVIKEIEATKLEIPHGYGPIFTKGNGNLVSTEIADDLYLVTDSSEKNNSLFKVNGDDITVFGASGYPALAKDTIKLISQKFPEKKITSVYVTHPHGYEIAGLNVYAEHGINILADEYTIAAIKAYPKFTDSIATSKFYTIKHEQIIDGAQFYVLDNNHSKKQSFVHFKESEIIFQSKFLHIAYDNTIAADIPNYTKTFVDFIRAKRLKFNRIVGNHQNNDISIEVLNKTYDAML